MGAAAGKNELSYRVLALAVTTPQAINAMIHATIVPEAAAKPEYSRIHNHAFPLLAAS